MQSKEDVARIYQALPEPVNVAYALSALAGLRPGEVLGLEGADVDLERKQIAVRRQVRHGKVDVPKSGKPRVVPIFDGLRGALTARRAQHPTDVLVCPPAPYRKKDGTTTIRRNRHGEAKHLNLRTVYAALEKALAGLGLPDMTFYEAGRHSFASLWVLAGQDIYRLSGSSVTGRSWSPSCTRTYPPPARSGQRGRRGAGLASSASLVTAPEPRERRHRACPWSGRTTRTARLSPDRIGGP